MPEPFVTVLFISDFVTLPKLALSLSAWYNACSDDKGGIMPIKVKIVKKVGGGEDPRFANMVRLRFNQRFLSILDTIPWGQEEPGEDELTLIPHYYCTPSYSGSFEDGLPTEPQYQWLGVLVNGDQDAGLAPGIWADDPVTHQSIQMYDPSTGFTDGITFYIPPEDLSTISPDALQFFDVYNPAPAVDMQWFTITGQPTYPASVIDVRGKIYPVWVTDDSDEYPFKYFEDSGATMFLQAGQISGVRKIVFGPVGERSITIASETNPDWCEWNSNFCGAIYADAANEQIVSALNSLGFELDPNFNWDGEGGYSGFRHLLSAQVSSAVGGAGTISTVAIDVDNVNKKWKSELVKASEKLVSSNYKYMDINTCSWFISVTPSSVLQMDCSGWETIPSNRDVFDISTASPRNLKIRCYTGGYAMYWEYDPNNAVI